MCLLRLSCVEYGVAMSQPMSGFLFDREMKEAGFTRHEMNNQRLRDAAYRLLVRGRLYRFNDEDEIEYGVSGPFNDVELP